jgi:hypothetical protein
LIICNFYDRTPARTRDDTGYKLLGFNDFLRLAAEAAFAAFLLKAMATGTGRASGDAYKASVPETLVGVRRSLATGPTGAQ